jgi:predicted anti-sigma-YlaC factor YlaD
MNCFEARKEFGSFWRRTLERETRASFVSHLGECSKCDRSFRTFALSAPVLHSEREPDPQIPSVGAVRATVRPLSARREPMRSGGTPGWRRAAAAAMLVVIGGVAAWSAALPLRQNVDVMEAIAGDDPSIEPVSYTPDTSLFGQDVIGSDPSLQEPIAPESNSVRSEGLAG